MSTLLGVAVLTPATSEAIEKVASLGVVMGDADAASRGFFIACDGWDLRVPESLASRISEAVRATCFHVAVQTSADVYVVGEYERGRLIRQLSFNRDDGGWAPPVGVERSWEADFHFALPAEEFLDRLSDSDDWTDADLEAARSAYEGRRLDQLPQLPDPCASTVSAFLKHRGVDVERPMARYPKPGLIGRLFGG
jgi:hypothetical protein